MRILLLCLLLLPNAGLASEWTEQSKSLLQQVKQQSKFQSPVEMKPIYEPMENGKSFFLLWAPKDTIPDYWIVSMPGTHSLVTEEFAIWSKSIAHRKVGLIEVQWWLGTGDSTKDYLTPMQIYPEIEKLLTRLRAKPAQAMLHGFSRGAANIYAVAALDRKKGGAFLVPSLQIQEVHLLDILQHAKWIEAPLATSHTKIQTGLLHAAKRMKTQSGMDVPQCEEHLIGFNQREGRL